MATIFGQTPRAVALLWQADPFVTAALPILTVLLAPLPALNLYCWKRVIDGVTLCLEGQTHNGRVLIISFLVASLVITLLLRGLDGLTRLLEKRLTLRLTGLIQRQVLEKSTALDMAFFETPAFYDRLVRAQQESGTRPHAILSSLCMGARQCATLCSYCAILFWLSWEMVVCLLLVAVPNLFLQARYGRLGWAIARKRTPDERQMHYYQYLLTSSYEAKEIRLFGLSDYLIREWTQLFRRFSRQDLTLTVRKHVAEFCAASLQSTATIGLFGFVIYRTVTDPAVGMGGLFMYTQAIQGAIGSLMVIFQSVGSLYEHSLYLGNFFEFNTLQPQVRSPPTPVPAPAEIREGLVFDAVSFRYPDSTKDALQDISVKIRPGERIAIVGENGSGKTTLVKLLARLYDPQEGRITVDGTDLREFDPREWQMRIGVIFQDFIRYWVSARDNIGFGQIDYRHDMPRILRAAQSSKVDQRIERLEHRWDTILGRFFEEGQELSLGEWQRMALARALFRDCPILILDEPTASLDATHEFEIFAQFDELTAGKTTILISHRFSTVRMADRVLVLEGGRLIESGAHDELLCNKSKYAEMFNRQASAYR